MALAHFLRIQGRIFAVQPVFVNTPKGVREKALAVITSFAKHVQQLAPMLPPDSSSTSDNKGGLQPLVALGLTQREAEVLTWVARGKSNSEIGVILGAASDTIRKHVEHILSKLNVENRTSAAATALAALYQIADFL